MLNFLEHYWDKIQPPQKEMGLPAEAVGQGYYRPWISDSANIYMIKEALKIIKPSKVIETGTYEGYTSLEMAKIIDKSCSDKKISGILYTFDAGVPIAVQDGRPVYDYKNSPLYNTWDLVIQKRKERLSTKLNNCDIIYVEGLIQDTLPAWQEQLKGWDFWYQDSDHGINSILFEINILFPISHIGSIVVFDDIIKGHALLDKFSTFSDWNYKWTENGRGQLWAQRIK